MNKNILFGILGVLALGGIAFGAWYFFFKAPSAATYSLETTPVEVLTAQNADFAAAIAEEKAKNYDQALLSYQKALPVAKDQVQKAQIQTKIAVMNEWLGNYKDAIAQLKAVAADTNNYTIARATAVQEIGFMNVYTTGEAQQVVLAETFKDAPYDSFRKDSSLNIAYIKLFEYATSLYPLGYSEAYIAFGYSGEVLNTLHGATTTPQAKAYISLIKESIRAASIDMERMRTVPGDESFIPETLAWQGVALSRLAVLGAAELQQAEIYFREGLAAGTTLGDRPGNFNTYNYAAFLMYHYGRARAADIKTLLLPFRVGNDAQIYPQMMDFFKNTRTEKSLVNEKPQMIRMANIDSDFKTYLISLGWKETDFK